MEELWIVTGDWQVDGTPPFDFRHEGKSVRFADSLACVDKVIADACGLARNPQKPTYLKGFFLGDATEHKAASSLERTELAKRFKAASDLFPWEAIPGNHDGSLYQLTSSTLEPIGILLPPERFDYHDTFSWKSTTDGKGRCLVFLPYLHGVSEEEIAKLFTNFFAAEGDHFKEFYLFGHYGVQGCASGAANQILAKDVLSLATIQAHRFKRVWMGHIHKAQWIKNVGFPGSTYSHDFGERLDKKGYITYNPDTDKSEFVEIKPTHPLRQVEWQNVLDPLWMDANGDDLLNAITKVVGYLPAEKDGQYLDIQQQVGVILSLNGGLASFWDIERERVYRESRSDVTTSQNLKEALKTYITENASKLQITDLDSVIAKAWAILEEQPAFKQQYADLRFDHIRYVDLLTFRDETISLADGIHLLAAPNGTGKSNALGGFFFAIAGDAVTGVNLASMVRQGASAGYAELVFHSRGDKYVLRRTVSINKSKGNGTQKITLTCNGADVKDGGNKEADDKAEALIGLDSLALRNTVFFVQDDPENIIEGNGRDRKAVVMSVLKMACLGDAWQASRGYLAVETQKVEHLKNKKAALDAITFDASREDLEKEKFVKAAEAADCLDKETQGEQALKGIEAVLTERRAAYMALSQEYSQHGDIQARPVSLKESWDAANTRVEGELIELRGRRDRCTAQITAWEGEVVIRGADAAEALKAIDVVKASERDELEKALRGLDLTYDGIKEQAMTLRVDINAKTQRRLEMNTFEGQEKCPTCGQATKHLHDRHMEDRRTLQGEINSLQARLNDANTAMTTNRNDRIVIQEKVDGILERENDLWNKASTAKNRIESLKNLIEREKTNFAEIVQTGKAKAADRSRQAADFEMKFAEALAAAEAAKTVMQRILSNVSETQGEITRLESSKNGITLAIKAHADKRIPAQVRIGIIDGQLKQMDDILAQKREVEFEWVKAAKELLLIEPLCKVFSPEGIQAALIESARPDLERRINHYLAALRVEKFRIQIETQAESVTTGNIKETFDLNVDAITRPAGSPMLDVRSYSGGEKQLMMVAIHFALADLAMERSGIRFPFYALDEIYAWLDAEKRKALTQLVFNLRADLIFVVCHIDDVINEYDSVIDGSFSIEDGTKFRPRAIPGRSDGIRQESIREGQEADANQGGNKGKATKRRTK